MTALVTVQASGALTRVRRYEGRAKGALLCTHEGFYQPDTVTAWNVVAYIDKGSNQDRRGWRTPVEASWESFGAQPA